MKPQKLRIKVRNTSGWHCNFHISPKREFVEAILEYYAQHNPIRQEDGTPSYFYGKDVLFYYDGSRIAYDAAPNNLGMAENDVVVIRHKVNILFNMPGSDRWDMK